jgi:hypothetical protein
MCHGPAAAASVVLQQATVGMPPATSAAKLRSTKHTARGATGRLVTVQAQQLQQVQLALLQQFQLLSQPQQQRRSLPHPQMHPTRSAALSEGCVAGMKTAGSAVDRKQTALLATVCWLDAGQGTAASQLAVSATALGSAVAGMCAGRGSVCVLSARCRAAVCRGIMRASTGMS